MGKGFNRYSGYVFQNRVFFRVYNISEKEVENVVNGRILIRSTSRKAEKLKEVIGASHGRILFVVLKLHGEKYRVITARDATGAEKKLYMKRGK